MLTHDIMKELNKTFLTPIDREDIHELAARIDDVLDLIWAAVDRMRSTRSRSRRASHLHRRGPADDGGHPEEAFASCARSSTPTCRSTALRSTASRTASTASTEMPSATF